MGEFEHEGAKFKEQDGKLIIEVPMPAGKTLDDIKSNIDQAPAERGCNCTYMIHSVMSL